MNGIAVFLGYIVIFLIFAFAVTFALSLLLKLKEADSSSVFNMPVLVPLPIPTKNQPSPLHKLVVFVTKIRRWKLAENWKFKLNNGITIVIPEGFEFDGASIPKIFWALLSPTGLLLLPGLIHDYGYRYDQIWKVEKDGSFVAYEKNAGKEYWDNLFQEVGDQVNAVFLINLIAKLAVLVGGRRTWDKYRVIGEEAKPPKISGSILMS